MPIMFTRGDGHIQQNNAPCYRARSVSDWFEIHQSGFELRPWPAQSPNHKPILSICGTKSKDHYNDWKRHSPICPNLELPLCQYEPTSLSNGASN